MIRMVVRVIRIGVTQLAVRLEPAPYLNGGVGVEFRIRLNWLTDTIS